MLFHTSFAMIACGLKHIATLFVILHISKEEHRAYFRCVLLIIYRLCRERTAKVSYYILTLHIFESYVLLLRFWAPINAVFVYFVRSLSFFIWHNSPQWASSSPFTRFLDHTQPRTTLGRTPLDELLVRRRDLYLTTHNIHHRQASMPRRNSKPQSQKASGGRPTLETAWPLQVNSGNLLGNVS
jgi:hypothetical protein